MKTLKAILLLIILPIVCEAKLYVNEVYIKGPIKDKYIIHLTIQKDNLKPKPYTIEIDSKEYEKYANDGKSILEEIVNDIKNKVE